MLDLFVAVLCGVFLDDQLIFFPAVREHWPDVGGMVPGSMSGNATEIYQEGIRIPPVKVVDAGTFRKDVWDLIFANIRLDIVREDMKAEIDRRLADLDANPHIAQPWDEVKARIMARLQG